jgi:hypothetical protein
MLPEIADLFSPVSRGTACNPAVCEKTLRKALRSRKPISVEQDEGRNGDEPDRHRREKAMTTTSLLLATAIFAQPMLVIGILLRDIIRDRRAA